ncbi:MAG: hypothetical protein IKA47_12865 [Oscillospiraceae bacterium]|nr:hypothetical protein [Oscillospiraceae bacterium]
MIAQQKDIDALVDAYAGRVIKFGELHNHTDAGPTADGWQSLATWKEEMQKLGLSFAAIVDHKQVAHMYHKDWRTQATEDCDVVFIGGSEPGTSILDSKAVQKNLHYNMLLNDPKKLLQVVQDNPKFCIKSARYEAFNWNAAYGSTNKAGTYDPMDYENDPTGILQTWTYPKFTVEEFNRFSNAIYDAGGLLVHVHPKYSSYLISDDPLDYFFGNVMGLEIFTCDRYGRSPSFEKNDDAYKVWADLVNIGKRVFATSGCDNHRMPSPYAMTAIYASPLPNSDEYMQYVHNGDIAPGWVGIRMLLGDVLMGGETDFADKRLIFSVGEMYQNAYAAEIPGEFDACYNPERTYTVQLITEKGVVWEQEIDPGKMNYFAFDADPKAKYYRVVVWDMTQGYRCGVGNPIWNTVE